MKKSEMPFTVVLIAGAVGAFMLANKLQARQTAQASAVADSALRLLPAQNSTLIETNYADFFGVSETYNSFLPTILP